MSTAKRPHSAFEIWSAEPAEAARKPSWLARRSVSVQPPEPEPQPPPAVPTIDEAQSFTPSEPESAVIEKAVPAAPAVDLGLSAALAQLAEENAALRAQITEMAATMVRLKREVLESSEHELVKLALTISERVVGRELQTDPNLIVAWAREAIQSLASKDEVVIALARDVAHQVPGETWSALDVEHRIDPMLPAGGIEIRGPEGVIAEGAPARLQAMAEALEVAES